MFVDLDDIVIYARSRKEHAIKFKKLMERLSNAGLRLQPDKCEFLRKEVAYLLVTHMTFAIGETPKTDIILRVRVPIHLAKVLPTAIKITVHGITGKTSVRIPTTSRVIATTKDSIVISTTIEIIPKIVILRNKIAHR